MSDMWSLVSWEPVVMWTTQLILNQDILAGAQRNVEKYQED